MNETPPPRLVEVPTISDPTGSIGVLEEGTNVPFTPRRAYFVHQLEVGTERGGHAHKTLHQFLVATSGAFAVHLEDGRASWDFRLDSPRTGIYCPPGFWRTLKALESASVLLVAASATFSEGDYIRNWQEFIEWRNHLK